MCPAQQIFLFNHQQEQISPFLKQATLFLTEHIPHKTQQLNFKVKAIITELLTNSIKHAGKAQTRVSLIVDGDNFLITKTDTGAPFAIKQSDAAAPKWQWPLTGYTSKPFKIYTDHLNGLFARITSPCSLHFFTEDYEPGENEINGLTEHYGLMIICRAADSFTYEFNSHTHENIFTVRISLL